MGRSRFSRVFPHKKASFIRLNGKKGFDPGTNPGWRLWESRRSGDVSGSGPSRPCAGAAGYDGMDIMRAWYGWRGSPICAESVAVFVPLSTCNVELNSLKSCKKWSGFKSR